VYARANLPRFVWPNAVVEENNLPRHISILRKALQQRPMAGSAGTIWMVEGVGSIDRPGLETRP